ncbi:MAG: zinc-dependent metalloprotease [Actinobacteria bacterium]|nr:zinc-dependent metalloprotease [Actinomycetota bacterium]
MTDTSTQPSAVTSESKAIDWAVAARVASWSASRSSVLPSYRVAPMQADFDDLTSEAEFLVTQVTGWLSPAGPARAKVASRSDWALANVASAKRLLGPTLSQVEMRRSKRFAGSEDPPHPVVDDGSHHSSAFTRILDSKRLSNKMTGVAGSISGFQLGLLLGWMSTRVLGQYDLLITDENQDEQDVVYYVGPNVFAIESRFGFPSRQFRLWLAIHEVTHRCQFTAVPWLRDHFVTLVNEGLSPIAADPGRMSSIVQKIVEDLVAGRNPFSESGLVGIVTSPEQLSALHRVQALMSLLEGHGDVVMNRAGASSIPGAKRFSQVLHQRRTQVKGSAKLIQQLLGMEAKLRQYAEGEKFVETVERIAGEELFARVWEGPVWLPSLEEIRNPEAWIARARANATPDTTLVG